MIRKRADSPFDDGATMSTAAKRRTTATGTRSTVAGARSSAARPSAAGARPSVKGRATQQSGRPKSAGKGGENTAMYVLSMMLFFLSVFMLVAVISYFLTWKEDQSIDTESFFVLDPFEARNLMGRFGVVIGHLFVGRWFGIFGVCLPVMVMMVSLVMFKIKVRRMRKGIVSLLMLTVIGSIFAAHFWPELNGIFGSSLGGGFGYYTAGWMDTIFGGLGADIILLMLLLLWLVYTTRYTIVFINVVTSSLAATVAMTIDLVKSRLNRPSKPRPMAAKQPQNVPQPTPVSSQPAQAAASSPVVPTPVAAQPEPATDAQPADSRPETKAREEVADKPVDIGTEPQAESHTPGDSVVTSSLGVFVKPEFHPQPLSERIDPLAFGNIEHRDLPRRRTAGKVRDEYGVSFDLDNAVMFTAPIIDESGKLIATSKNLNDMSDDEIDELLSLANEKTVVASPVDVSGARNEPSDDEEFFIIDQSEPSEFVAYDDKVHGSLSGIDDNTSDDGFEVTDGGIGAAYDIPLGGSYEASSGDVPNGVGSEVELVIEKPQGTAEPLYVGSYDSDSGFELASTAGTSLAPTTGASDDTGDDMADDGLVITTNTPDEMDDDDIDVSVYDPTRELSRYKLPPIELLDNHTRPVTVTEEEIYENKNSIVRTLENFSIKIDKIKATIGPTVTLYEIVPAPGVRISKIKNLEDDIALSLSALGIRIIAPIPGKGTIGIEVPNKDKEVVSMYSVLKSSKFQECGYDLPVVLGRTIQNEDFVIDLAKMPHMLVAGATGQGKSVGLNAIITSLLYKKHPAELKFVLVDPKKVELTLYSNLEKHFLAKMPEEEEAIITDTQKVVYTLNSLCMEMDTRYDLLKKAKVRNIKEYNEKFTERRLNPNKGHRFMPYFVVIIDEFADLIMTAGREIETPIARLAQLARAVGIHLVIATQRPTTNIITGVIKANFPARIAFRVSSMIDSRTILDQPGANQLIGRGDMLVSTGNETTRVQCAFIDTPEVEKITEYIGAQQGYPDAYELPEYQPEEKEGDSESAGVTTSRRDGLFDEVARYVVTNQQGSASTIQRNFSIGFNRAGRIMDQLERAGIVGKQNGSKPRTVLIGDIASLEVLLYELDRGNNEME